MLKVIVVLVKAGSCPRGRNLDNRCVTLWLIFSTGSSSVRYGEPENLEVASEESCLAPVPTSAWPCGKT